MWSLWTLIPNNQQVFKGKTTGENNLETVRGLKQKKRFIIRKYKFAK